MLVLNGMFLLLHDTFFMKPIWIARSIHPESYGMWVGFVSKSITKSWLFEKKCLLQQGLQFPYRISNMRVINVLVQSASRHWRRGRHNQVVRLFPLGKIGSQYTISRHIGPAIYIVAKLQWKRHQCYTVSRQRHGSGIEISSTAGLRVELEVTTNFDYG